MTSLSKDESENYAEAGAVAEEVLSSVRTVVAFGGQEKEVGKYAALLKSAQKNAFIRGGLTATTMGLFFGFIYGMYGLGLWYGVKLMLDDRETEEFINCTISCNQKFTVTDEIVECVNSCFRFRASNEHSARFLNHREGPYLGLLLVESAFIFKSLLRYYAEKVPKHGR